jgi:ADP-ribose pyrophosphatase YjhB (NUDIX family)
LSLFYGDVTELTTIPESRRYLPTDMYRTMVLDAVVCCVDILAVRTTTRRRGGGGGGGGTTAAQQMTKECLLVERAAEPVKGVWWLPGQYFLYPSRIYIYVYIYIVVSSFHYLFLVIGGRLWKGETFFAAAIRKAREETGLINVRPVQVLGVWNTFFPTSNWDTSDKKGTQTVNPIVLIELLDDDADVQLDTTSENYRWIGLDPNTAIANGEDRYVVQALLRLQAWDPQYMKC